MARIRTLKPEILEDARTAGLSDAAFRLFVAMIVLADYHGNLRADDRWLAGQVWWARGEFPRVAETLRELQEADLLTVYEVREQVYAAISGWTKHQRIDNAGKPRVPQLSDGSQILAAKFREIPLELAAGPRPPTTTTTTDYTQPEAAPKIRARRMGTIRSAITEGWVPDRSEANISTEAAGKQRGIDLRVELQSMRDWAKGENAKKADWDATWRNWVRRAKPRNAQGTQTTMPQVAIRKVPQL